MAWNQTAIKTAGYNASVDDLVRCDCSAGAFAVMLPFGVADGSLVAVAIWNAPGSGNVLVMQDTYPMPGYGTGLNMIASCSNLPAVHLHYQWETIVFQYIAAEKCWRLTSWQIG